MIPKSCDDKSFHPIPTPGSQVLLYDEVALSFDFSDVQRDRLGETTNFLFLKSTCMLKSLCGGEQTRFQTKYLPLAFGPATGLVDPTTNLIGLHL